MGVNLGELEPVTRDEFNSWLQTCQAIFPEAVVREKDARERSIHDQDRDGWVALNAVCSVYKKADRTGPLIKASYSLGVDSHVFVISHPLTEKATYWINAAKVRQFIYGDWHA